MRAALLFTLCFHLGSALAALDISLAPAAHNPRAPQMGDQVSFVSTIVNKSRAPARGVVAWLSLIQVDPGHEQPMDLEDWSAHKAVTLAEIAPGGRVQAEWPMRLIQAGTYRVAVIAVERHAPRAVASPFAEIKVRAKPVVESRRILPVSLGVPLALAALLFFSLARRRRKPVSQSAS
jgi:hypothetical protein